MVDVVLFAHFKPIGDENIPNAFSRKRIRHRTTTTRITVLIGGDIGTYASSKYKHTPTITKVKIIVIIVIASPVVLSGPVPVE
jgi:hypothetical protein